MNPKQKMLRVNSPGLMSRTPPSRWPYLLVGNWRENGHRLSPTTTTTKIVGLRDGGIQKTKDKNTFCPQQIKDHTINSWGQNSCFPFLFSEYLSVDPPFLYQPAGHNRETFVGFPALLAGWRGVVHKLLLRKETKIWVWKYTEIPK